MKKIYDRSISTVVENGKKISLVGLAVPLLLENVFLLLYGTINTAILSGYSDMAVSATSVAEQVSNLGVVLLGMISKGAVIVTSVALGSGNRQRASNVAGSGFVMTLLFGSLLAAVLYFHAERFMGMMHLSGELQGMAAVYLRLVGALLPVTATLSYFNNLLICNGYSKITMISGLLSNGIHLALCTFALYSGMELPVSGVAAVAICGGIAKAFGLILSSGYYFCKKCPFRISASPKESLYVLKFGVPAGMSLLSYYFSQTVTTGFITTWGVAVINTKTYVSNLLQYTSRVSISLGTAGGILTGRHRGACRMDAIDKLFWQNISLAIVCNFLISLLAFAFYKPLLSIFTNDPEIIASARTIMIMDIAVEIFRAVNHIAESAFNANGRVKTALLTATVSAWCCNVLFSYVFAVVLNWGLLGLWLAIILDECFKATVYLISWRTGKWKKAHI